MSKEFIKSIIREFHTQEVPQYFSRDIVIPLNTDKIITLIGPRRSGKTAELFNIINQLIFSGVERHAILYINFEDERFDYTTDDLDKIINAYLELYPSIDLKACYLFFDEIQNIERWDKYVRRLYDSVSKRIFISGSNAKLLSSEIATSLRGRALSYQILPFSFREYCQFQQINLDLLIRANRARVIHALAVYLEFGGFPEIVHFENELKIKTLQEYFNTMIYRDMIERYEIKNTTVLKYFLKRLFSSVTKNISVNKIFNELKSSGFKIAKQQLYDYLDMSEGIFMSIILKKYDPTIINQELGEKKIYIIDNGLMNAVTFKFSEDIGKCMEQVVLLELIRREKQVYFYRGKYECDFVVQTGFDITAAFQVCYELDNQATLEREINGLTEACHQLMLNKGVIICNDRTDVLESDGINITFIPLCDWLLQSE